MSSKTFYTCDKCGRTTENASDLKNVSFGLGCIGFSYMSTSNVKIFKNYELCSDCLTKLGYYNKTKEKKSEPVPDLKDKLYDLFVELVQEVGGNNENIR